MTWEAWANELQETIELVTAHSDGLQEFLLDHVGWEAAYDAGRTPDEALGDVLMALKSRPDPLKHFLQMRG